MPVSHSSLVAVQEPASLNHELAAANCAYRLISQLRQHPPVLRGNPSRPETEREARSLRAVEYFGSHQP